MMILCLWNDDKYNNFISFLLSKKDDEERKLGFLLDL